MYLLHQNKTTIFEKIFPHELSTTILYYAPHPYYIGKFKNPQIFTKFINICKIHHSFECAPYQSVFQEACYYAAPIFLCFCMCDCVRAFEFMLKNILLRTKWYVLLSNTAWNASVEKSTSANQSTKFHYSWVHYIQNKTYFKAVFTNNFSLDCIFALYFCTKTTRSKYCKSLVVWKFRRQNWNLPVTKATYKNSLTQNCFPYRYKSITR